MLEQLNLIDRAAFLFINMQLANPVTNFVMPFVTSDTLLRIMYGTAMAVLLWRGNARVRWLVAFSAVALLLSDQISSQFLKKLIERPRPCHVMEEINLLVGCGGGFSMPSSHAANAWAQAFMFSVAAKEVKWYLYAFAATVALSRTFVGVHYPGDILAGTILGALIGVPLALGYKKFTIRFYDEGKPENVV